MIQAKKYKNKFFHRKIEFEISHRLIFVNIQFQFSQKQRKTVYIIFNKESTNFTSRNIKFIKL